MRGLLLHQLRRPCQDEVAKITAVLAAADARSHRAADAHGEIRYLDTISHASRVLEVEPTNVKALFRRGQAHLLRPDHINGLALALEDLRRAAELEPADAGVRSMLARARAQQKALDQKDASMFGRMLG